MTGLNNFSIGQRMAAGFGALLILLGALLGSIYSWQQDAEHAQRNFTQHSRPLTDAAHTLEHGILRVGITLRGYLLNPEPARIDRFTQAVGSARTQLQQLGSMPKDADAENLFRELDPAVRRYLSATEDAVQLRRLGVIDAAAEGRLQIVRESLIAITQDFIDLQTANMGRAITVMGQAQQRVARGLLTTGALSILCFIVLAWLITQSIRKPAGELVRIATALKDGDWKPALALAEAPGNGRVNEVQNNEMARIGRAFGFAAVALEQREQRLAADHQVAGAAAASLDKSDVAAAALRAIVGHVRAEIGIVYWGTKAGTLTPVASYGASTASRELPIGDGVPGQAALERRTVVLRDIPRDAPFSVKLGYDEAPPRDVVAVPIMFRNELVGVLVVASLRRLDEQAVEFLESAAAQLGVGLNNVRAYEEIQRLLNEVAEKSQQIQAQNEELQAQNEEIQAQSEEVQAQNEELQAQGEEIRAQNEQLAEQAEHLHRHAALLAEADQRKTEFLGLLAHELRNPMAGISNSLFVLSRPGLDGQQAATAQAIIGRQTRQLNRLIDDLLDVTRVTRGKVKLKTETLDLVDVVRDCLDDHRATFDKAKLALTIDVPGEAIIVRGDRARICQIIGNLVDNAAKFTDEGRHVSVSLKADEGRGLAELQVADEGIGIDKAAFSRLFQPFSQGDPNLTRTNGGLGLGLALVKALVEMHQGTVEAYSDGPGKGARFTVRLPLLREATRKDVVKKTAGAESLRVAVAPCRILIIEDNVDVALSLSAALSMEGHDVRMAHTAQEGLELAHSFRPDLLLCDIGLPIMDGYEVARRFRADDELKSVFLVAVTGYASEKDREQAAQAGFDRHMPKPPDFQQLSELLAEITIRRARNSSADAESGE